ncbi:DUF2634 domain-containing protein [Chengkuizengella axinellae]|uniref:DUF2634 domain-containing protein n=1 Tax=Chengkuizengella axinellae TaxID=3064388 RepID=A0ABT9J3Z6_9BACL|nr:DUF2634 domain-containing protein [Chengkuizengella sp. 2205SS18-9]MDP5275699.1 DUF2634 domain-containing protein [Chengkuizengella sp. 2205SS18-9]
MALSPIAELITRETEADTMTTIKTVYPSKTYKFDFDTGEIKGNIDGMEAIKQFVRKALSTPRFRYLIYTNQYGSELEDLIGQNIPDELVDAEVPRLIEEAISYDDRILAVSNFSISRKGDALYATFEVDTVDGTIEQEVKV